MVEIGIHPNLFSADFLQGLTMSWHGFYSFVAVATAVLLVGRLAPLRGIDPDAVYSIAIWAIVGGFFGARLAFIVDNWDIYQHRPEEFLYVWQGGLAVWGGLIGGFVGGVVATLVSKQPVGRIADLAAPALLLGLTIGRVGDIVNGEHCAKGAELIGFVWTNDASPARFIPCQSGWGVGNAAHGVIVYEMLWNAAAVAVVWWLLGRLKPDGMVFAAAMGLYAVGRFWTMFFRDENQYVLDLVQAQLISVLILVVVVPLLLARARLAEAAAEPAGPAVRVPRAQRRRRR